MIVGALLAALALAAGPGEVPTAVPHPGEAPTPTATATPTPTATPTATATATDADDAVATDAAPAPDAAAAPAADDAPPLPTAPAGPALSQSAPVLLSRVARPGGHALERLIEPSGDVVQHEVNAAGTVLSCRTVGSIRSMRMIAQQPAVGGEFLAVARDDSGALVQFVVDAEGEPRAVALLAPGF